MKAKTDLSKLKAERKFLIRLLHFENNEIVILGAEKRLADIMEAIAQHEYGLKLFRTVEMTTEFRTPRDQEEWHEIRSNLADYGRQVMLGDSYQNSIRTAAAHQAFKLEQMRREDR